MKPLRSMPILLALSLAAVLLAGHAFTQSPELPPEVMNRPLKPCSSPPGVDSHVNGVLWPGGVVPYAFDANVTAAQQTAMLDAMKEWENVSPVRFVTRTNEPDYIHIKDDSWNWSHIGKIGGKQEIGIYNWNTKFEMAHQLCQALGFAPEHQRPDRDTFVTIAPWKLNEPGYRLEWDALVTSSYDFDSVMHYDWTNITVKSHHSSIWQSRIGQRDHLSIGDIRGMQIAYGEPNRPPSEYGFATTSTDFIPTFHTQGEFACIGNDRFQLVSRNLMGGTPGMLVISTGKASTVLGAGLRVYVDLTGIPLLSWFPLPAKASGSSGVQGAGEVILPIALPNVRSLVGTQLFLQGTFFEGGGRYGTTAGMWLTFHDAISRDVTCLYDRKSYQQHVTSAAVGQAVWTANAVPGFGYVKTEKFTCGGETHWIVIVQHQQTGMEFCLIPGGSYRMGDINNTGYASEKPVHWVHLEPFLLSRTEVTQGQFYTVMGTEPWKGQSYVKIGSNHAASYVDWYDATTFGAKLGMRLPTESEWEYASRSGTTTCFSFGENYPPTSIVGSYAWYCDNAYYASEKYAHQVGQKLPNAFGLHDMAGNVWEWCVDLFHRDYSGAPTNGWPWDGDGRERVLRGGCWRYDTWRCSSVHRYVDEPGIRNDYYGFRVARPLR